MEEYERVYCYESLYQAHKLARRGKQDTREVILYEMRLSEHIERLSYHLPSGREWTFSDFIFI